ncbi:hypothetical protein EKD04_009400 [Chloroflexales bacterium ZM16-3]|nr:hypothetical protein [Chloroflexales bacterium ZM16-3]
MRIADMFPDVRDWRPARRVMVAELMTETVPNLEAILAKAGVPPPAGVQRGRAYKRNLAKLVALDEFPIVTPSPAQRAGTTRIRAY